MSTSQLFVELVVVGFGTTTVMSLLAVAVFGSAWLTPFLSIDGAVSVFILLATCYVLGILIDRLADMAFHASNRRLRDQYFMSEAHYYDAKKKMLSEEVELKAFEYGRTRLRISRGWVVNGAALGPAAIAAACARLDGSARLEALVLAAITSMVLAYLSWRSWAALSRSQYAAIARYRAVVQEA